ncbi:hypothetical protein ABZ897_42875 [Nonomuraea sp. NPDC046802]|uniref:hypothetical protein n=1 Tax=Nonomuraea sp. NPDC046802 TaxID=3154919 RepID=UPI0033E7A116
MTRRQVIPDAEAIAELTALPPGLRENALAIFELLATDPEPLGAHPYGGIPDAYEFAIAGLVVLYTVEEKSVSIWRVRADT